MLNHNVAWSGTFLRCAQFARRLVQRGHECTIVTISPRRRLALKVHVWKGVRIVETPDLLWGMGRSGWDLWDLLRRQLWLRNQRYDLVHAFDCRPVVVHPALAARRHAQAPLVIDWADWWGRGGAAAERRNPFLRHVFIHLETFYEEHFRRCADATTVISKALEHRAIALGVLPETITRLGSGADLELFFPMDREEARRQIGLAAGGPVVGFMGNVQYDLDLVLATFGLLHRVAPHARLLLTGRRSPLVTRFKASDSAGQAVHEAGRVPFESLNAHMNACDVLLLPLRDTLANRARSPQKLCDYLATGHPILTNPTGEVGELFGSHCIGAAVEADPEAMSQALRVLLADPAGLSARGRNARRLAETELSYDHLTDRLADVYQRAGA
jgi:glycosyltransferase involved in cell wall biosynthesis